MQRIIAIEKPGAGAASDHVSLDHDQRTRRRMMFQTAHGRAILLDLLRPGHLRDGDLLRLEDGTLVRVDAQNEAIIEIGAGSTAALVRIAWHLGNRHLPTQLVPGADGGRLRIREDHVIAEMVVGLGGSCTRLLAPFDPERGAYAEGGGHAHAHSHAADHHDHHGHHHHHAHSHG